MQLCHRMFLFLLVCWKISRKNAFGTGDYSTMRFLIEQAGHNINISRDFRRYIIRPEKKLVYTFTDEGKLDSKYFYITERIERRDDKDNDLREFCLIIQVGDKIPITTQERKELGTVRLN